MPTCEPVECVYTDYYGGDKKRIESYGKRRKRASFTPAQSLTSVLSRNARAFTGTLLGTQY